MKKLLCLIVGMSLLFSVRFCFSQNNVSVNPLTGAASVYIPIYTVSQGQVSVPVGLAYNGTGVKPKDVEGTAGIGWNINAGGAINRVARGLPDDVIKDNAGNNRYGWMSPLDTGASKIATMPIYNNGSNCSQETQDINYITANFPLRFDTEPDLFYVNAPGLSCQLVYNRDSSKFFPVSYQDLVISYTLVGGSGNNKTNIASFTITNDQGIKYVFANPEVLTQKSTGTPTYYKTQYQQYQYGITYDDSWNLTSITDANGNGVVINYSTVPQTSGADSVALYLNTSSSYSLQYRTLNTVTSQRISSIYTTNANYSTPRLTFQWKTLSSPTSTGQTVIDSIKFAGLAYAFIYDNAVYSGKTYYRSFLRNVNSPGCGSPVNYSFQYIGNYSTSGNSYTSLPDSTSIKRDYWGYYSTTPSTASLMPKVWMAGVGFNIQPCAIYETNTGAVDIYPYSTTNSNAAVRSADPTYVMTGSLNKVSYAQGGSTNIVYESNDYRDVPSGNVVLGNGIRVKQIIDSAGTGSTNPIIRNYSYINPNTGLSSGKPLSLPNFAFTVPYSGALTGSNLYNYVTALSAYDLSSEDHTIMYEYAKVSQTGTGYTQYQYYVPATNWDASAKPDCSGCTTAEWSPTIDYVGRTNCTATYGPISNYTNRYTYSYPFISNINYDFERGLPLKISSYNNDTTPKEVSEVDYVYQRSYTPKYVYGFRWEDDPSTSGDVTVKCYGKYRVFYNTSELTDTVTTKIFDSSGTGSYQTSTKIYTYGSTSHRLLTQEKVTNSDNSVLTTNMRYIKDYAPNSSTNANINAMYQLKLLNINAPVETWNQVTRGATTVTTSASLTLFNKYIVGSTTHYLPSQQWKLVKADGEASFAPFSINTSTPSIAVDTGYIQVANMDTYDDTGFPLTEDDTHKNFHTNILDHYSGHITASIANASYKEFAFSDFDSDFGYNNYIPDYYFTWTLPHDTTTIITGSHSGYAMKFDNTQTLSHSIIKNTSATNYILSLWIQAPAGTNTLHVSLNGGTPITCSYSGAGMTKWKYYEWKLPLTGLPSTFTVAITTSQTIGIDDVIFYPDVAEVSTDSYDKTTHARIAATNTNGVSAYYKNDQWGRPLYVLNQDKNIVQKNTFVSGTDVADFAPVINAGTGVVNTPVAFGISGVPSCSAAGVTVNWDFGDSTAPVNTALTTSPSHTYTTFGTFTVTAKVKSALYGTKTITAPVVITPGNITLSYTNNQPGGNGNLSSLTFSQGGVVKYTFLNYQINGATIKQGIYNITASITNTLLKTTYSFSLTGDCYFGCNNYTANSNLTFNYTADLSTCTTLSVWMSNTHCGTPP